MQQAVTVAPVERRPVADHLAGSGDLGRDLDPVAVAGPRQPAPDDLLGQADRLAADGFTGYISAQSMKVIATSRAASICAWPSASAVWLPKVIVPRQIRLTSTALPAQFHTFHRTTSLFAISGAG